MRTGAEMEEAAVTAEEAAICIPAQKDILIIRYRPKPKGGNRGETAVSEPIHLPEAEVHRAAEPLAIIKGVMATATESLR